MGYNTIEVIVSLVHSIQSLPPPPPLSHKHTHAGRCGLVWHVCMCWSTPLSKASSSPPQPTVCQKPSNTSPGKLPPHLIPTHRDLSPIMIRVPQPIFLLLLLFVVSTSTLIKDLIYQSVKNELYQTYNTNEKRSIPDILYMLIKYKLISLLNFKTSVSVI